MRVAYKRVSTSDQSVDRQDIPDVEQEFVDVFTGKTKDRPELQKMITFVRQGDEVIVHSIDRLGRSLIDLDAIVKAINAKGASVSFVKERIKFDPAADNPFDRMMFQILGSFAEFERAIIHERQMEGIQKAKARGVYKGRKIEKPFDLQEARRLRNGGMSYAAIAKALKCNVATLHKRLTQAAEHQG